MRTIETTGILDDQGNLQLDTPLPKGKPGRVRVIMLLAEENDADEELTEETWVNAIATNPSFAFLNDSEEDIYTLADGQPVSDER